jgi:hypothetical protein
MAKNQKPSLKWTSGDITGSQVVIGDSNVMIQGNENKVVQNKITGISQAELRKLRNQFTSLKGQINAIAPANKKAAALQKADKLQEAVLSKKPNPAAMAKIRDWFVKNLPSVAGAVTAVVVDPIVGKLVAAAGDAVAGEFRHHFGGA